MRTKQEIADEAKVLASEVGPLNRIHTLARLIHDLARSDETGQADLIAALRADVGRLTEERDALKASAARDAQGFGQEIDRLHRIAMSYKLDRTGSPEKLEPIATRIGFEVNRVDGLVGGLIEASRDDLTAFVGTFPEVFGFLRGWEQGHLTGVQGGKANEPRTRTVDHCDDAMWSLVTSAAAGNGFHVTKCRKDGKETTTASRSGRSPFTGTMREVHAYLIGWERSAHNEGR